MAAFDIKLTVIALNLLLQVTNKVNENWASISRSLEAHYRCACVRFADVFSPNINHKNVRLLSVY
mgnify:CR=1 FL=1